MWENLFLTKRFFFPGEGNNVTEEMTNPWKETTLQIILSNYAKIDIYNAGKFFVLQGFTEKSSSSKR